MNNMITLESGYSTTRHVIKKKPVTEKRLDDKLESVLFLPEVERRQGEGGLKTQGYFKASLNDKPLITVITVVFNGEKYLEETILSVINQTYDNVEYIIIDGGSADGTLDIIQKYEHTIDYWVSEPDKGIYDAMNKGIQLSTGEWVNFMNAGDVFYNKSILGDVFGKGSMELLAYDVLVGGSIALSSWGELKQPARLSSEQWKSFCHQSVFSNRKNEQLFFDLNYKLAGDYDFMYRTIMSGGRFLSLDFPVSKVLFVDEGASASNQFLSKFDVLKSIINHRKELASFFPHFSYHFVRFIINRLKFIISISPPLLNYLRKKRDGKL